MSLRDSWARRSPGEQRLALGLAIAVAAVLLVALVWLPLER